MSRQKLINQGFTSDIPTETGKYLLTCGETDYDTTDVHVIYNPNGLVCIDNSPWKWYVDEPPLTDVMWRKVT